MAAKARAGSEVKAEDRVYCFQPCTAHKYLSGQHLDALNERFMATFDRDFETIYISILPTIVLVAMFTVCFLALAFCVFVLTFNF